MTVSLEDPTLQTTTSLAMSWRALPLDPVETTKFYYTYGIWFTFWALAFFVGGYFHPIPS